MMAKGQQRIKRMHQRIKVSMDLRFCLQNSKAVPSGKMCLSAEIQPIRRKCLSR